MIRRVAEHKAITLDGDVLTIITIFEPGASKETIKRETRYSKRHDVLVNNGNFYDYNKKA